ncbi:MULTISPECIES: penicillin-binding transpeptidase domain-containing protein [Ruminococcus]|uniref:beta-lactamase n=1 Tax=Ruminococcus flavefaciens TaxID=1265 RepID=A0A315YPW4_RUMFL|nr:MULTISPECIES: penicillin-binding transpeptidase domain-containing protein [Ruminococcus]MBR1430786.1 peptidoglycan glycosyltransferase [Ruminococcus sp.]PWJ14052.1 penicillin binding protein [Ruminococcus flavefaciens]SSA43695.1 Penicillin binding protein transpeptidase domain-containing protein [Ruminococcus flavefaciens]
MISRGKKLIALLISTAVIASFPSCSSEVGQIEFHKDSSPHAASEESGDTAPADVTTEQTTTTTTTTEPVYKGNIYDTNYNLITYSTYAEGGEEQRTYGQGYAYSFGNIVSEASAGFDDVFGDILRVKNPTPVTAENNVGQSIRLTIDADVQTALCSYMANMGMAGSIVVLRTDGSILAEVSYPTYDPELFYSDPTYVDSLSGGTIANKAFQNASPGSCFKIMSEVIADKNGITTLYDDGTWVDGGATIVNWDHDTGWYPVPERTLYSAFVNSSNIYFAKVFDQLGTDTVLADLNNIFHFCDTINCDFGPIENNIEIYCLDDLRRSAFGQAYVRTCPIYLAALGREAIFGDMVKPFVVQQVVDTTDPYTQVLPGSAPYEVLGSIPENCRQNLLDGMTGVANNLGLYVPENYQFYAKTGTAETGAGDFLYITGCLRNVNDNSAQKPVYTNYNDYGANGSYIIVMQLQNPADFGFDFASQTGSLYQGVINTVLSY